MLFTRRFLILLGIGVFPLVFSTTFRVLIYFTAGYDLILFCLAIMDFFRGASPDSLKLVRRSEAKFSLGAENPVWIDIRNNSRFTIKIRVKDEYPCQFRTINPLLETTVPRSSKTSLKYSLMPDCRGDYQFGNLNYRYVSPLGLVVRQGKQEAGEHVKVYPNLMDIRKYELIHRRSHLIETGIRRSRLRGRGTNFESLREYVPDDDIRWVDWKNTARHNRPISRNYEVERAQNLLLLIDTGRMMAAKIGNLTRLDYAVNTSLMLGHIAIRQGDTVGVLSFSDEVISYLPPTKQLSLLIEMLYPVKAELREPDYRKVSRFLSSNCRKRSLVVVFTGLSDTLSSSSLLSCISALALRHLPLIVAVNVPQLIETSSIMPEDFFAACEKAVANRLLAEREEILNTLVKKGALALDVPAEKLSPAVINKYLEIKRKGRL